MECGGMVRPVGAARIPVQFIANSTSGSRNNKQLDGREPHQPRHHQHQQHQRRRSVTSVRDNHVPSSINGRLVDYPSLSPNMADDSVETVLREWGARTETTRPPTVTSRPDRDRRSRQRCRERPTRTRAESSDTIRPASSGVGGDSLRRSQITLSGGTADDYSSGEESSGDDVISRTRSTSTRSPGTDSSTSRTFHVEFDAEGYDVDDISVRVGAGRRLVVHGVRRETDGARTSTTEFCRKIRLPDDVDPAHLDCYLQPDGRVVVQAPRRPRRAPPVGDGTQTAGELLNVPVVTGGDRRQLGLLVEVGRLFRADDVVVKVKNSALTLTVAAERTEPAAAELSGGRGRLNASVTWEFDLPAAVNVDTLRAGLTVEGLLRVTARLTSAPPSSPAAVNSTV